MKFKLMHLATQLNLLPEIPAHAREKAEVLLDSNGNPRSARSRRTTHHKKMKTERRKEANKDKKVGILVAVGWPREDNWFVDQAFPGMVKPGDGRWRDLEFTMAEAAESISNLTSAKEVDAIHNRIDSFANELEKWREWRVAEYLRSTVQPRCKALARVIRAHKESVERAEAKKKARR